MGAQAQLPPLGPEDSVELFDCLKQSLNQDPLVQKSAEAALEQYERRPNFCACLAVSEAHRLAPHIRDTPQANLMWHDCRKY